MALENDFNKSIIVPELKDDREAQDQGVGLAALRKDKGAVAYTLTDPKMRLKSRIRNPVILLASGPVYGLSSNILVVSIPGYGSVMVDKAEIKPGRLAKAGLSVRASRILSHKLNEVLA